MVYYWGCNKVVDNMFEEIVLEVTDKKKMKVVDKVNKHCQRHNGPEG